MMEQILPLELNLLLLLLLQPMQILIRCMLVSVTKQLKLGIQGVNLLDEVTQTSQVIDFSGTRATRSAFRNDRRFTFLARFEF